MLRKEREQKKKAIPELTPGQRVTLHIELAKTEGMKNILKLNSLVEDTPDEETVIIQVPIYKGYHYSLTRDNEISMYFSADGGMYMQTVLFLERINYENLIFAKMQRVGEITPHQLRDSFRLPCALPVSIERPYTDKDALVYEGRMMDFSESGILFGTNEAVEAGELLHLTFDIGGIETVEATVIRTEEPESRRYRQKVAVHMHYEDINQRQRFYKFIIDKQMEERWRHTRSLNVLNSDTSDTE